MLKKLRWRFIAAAMSAFCAVVLTLLCVINLWNYKNVTDQQDLMLDMIMMKNNEEVPPVENMPQEMKGFSPEVQYTLRFFSVDYDDCNNVVNINQDFIASITQDDALNYAKEALEKGKERGYIDGYRYHIRSFGGGKSVIFLNSEREIEAIKSLFFTTLTIALGCLVLVFILILILSRRAITPYVRNLENQKQFITNASHELKTPLTAISTSADVLSMEQPDNEWVENIQMQTSKMARLISNLVTLSRLDEENPFPQKTEFSLSDAVWEASEPFCSVMKAKGKNYSREIEDDVKLIGDQSAIQQMVSILLDNALKYSSENADVKLILRSRGKKAELIVSNTCSENKLEDIERIFDRFYTRDSSHSQNGSGNGIGLSIVKATLQAHGGKISVKQEGNVITFCAVL